MEVHHRSRKSEEATYLSFSQVKVSHKKVGAWQLLGVVGVRDGPINAFRAFPNPGEDCETEHEGFLTPTAVHLSTTFLAHCGLNLPFGWHKTQAKDGILRGAESGLRAVSEAQDPSPWPALDHLDLVMRGLTFNE